MSDMIIEKNPSPWEFPILDGFLTIFPPYIAIMDIILTFQIEAYGCILFHICSLRIHVVIIHPINTKFERCYASINSIGPH